jgi:hypothetical protein
MYFKINGLYKFDKQNTIPCLMFDTAKLFISIFNQIITLKLIT